MKKITKTLKKILLAVSIVLAILNICQFFINLVLQNKIDDINEKLSLTTIELNESKSKLNNLLIKSEEQKIEIHKHEEKLKYYEIRKIEENNCSNLQIDFVIFSNFVGMLQGLIEKEEIEKFITEEILNTELPLNTKRQILKNDLYNTIINEINNYYEANEIKNPDDCTWETMMELFSKDLLFIMISNIGNNVADNVEINITKFSKKYPENDLEKNKYNIRHIETSKSVLILVSSDLKEEYDYNFIHGSLKYKDSFLNEIITSDFSGLSTPVIISTTIIFAG